MMISEQIQRAIHALEVGAFSRLIKILPLVAAVIGLGFYYDLTSYRGFNSLEAMDAAQVARNLAEGRGYTTDFIRPFSVHLVERHNQKIRAGGSGATNIVDFAQLNGAHPDLANAPLYPTVLAGMIKFWRPNWTAETRKPFWSGGGRFLRYQAEFRIAIMNQILLLVVVALTFLIAKKLFDSQAAWLAALLTLGAEVLWKFSVSGQSTLLLLVIFLSLVWCLVKIEELGRAEKPPVKKLFALAVAVGLIAGAGMLTRYAFGWAIVPAAFFLVLFGGVRRPWLALAAILSFGLAVTPWIVRNFAVSGAPFGTAGYALVEGTFVFPGTQLMQSVNPDMTLVYWMRPYTVKLVANLRSILEGDLLRVGGSWLAMLFFAGLMLGFRNAAARRLRYFTMMCLGVFVAVQALGRTQLSTDAPEINSENLLVLLTPLAVIFGTVFFLTLLDQMKLPTPQIRLAVIALLVLVSCQPLIASLLPPKTSPVAFPPYNPPEIQKVSDWMRPDELMMSDIPWAVAWYGDRECLWLTANSQSEFFQFNDHFKQVRAVYLSFNALDIKLFTGCLETGADSWGNFALNIIVNNQMPSQPTLQMPSRFSNAQMPMQFPLRYAPAGMASGIFLTDRQRWPTE